jgi:hypothetical protein
MQLMPEGFVDDIPMFNGEDDIFPSESGSE